MFRTLKLIHIPISALTIAAIWLAPLTAEAQGLYAVSSITGSSSVFVFRSAAKSVKRITAAIKPKRTQEQRLQSVTKIKRQYETIAQTQPRENRAKAIEPNKLPPNARTLPAAQGAKLFAGVGEYYMNRGEYDKAIDFFRDAVTLDSANTEAKNGFSEALGMKGNDLLVSNQAAAAKSVFLEALKYNPKNAAANFGLGEVYAELDQDKEAIAAYEKSLESDKGLTEIYTPLGILYYQAGEIAKADELLTKAIAVSGEGADTQFFLGLVRYAQNRNDEALAAFEKAGTIDPKLAEAFYYSGETLVRLKRAADAVVQYKAAIDIRANYLDAYIGLGEAYFELKNYPDAIAAYKIAAKLKNDNWEIFAGLAEALRESGDYNGAEANYNLAGLFLTRNPEFNKDTAADLYSKVGYVIGLQCEINIKNFVACKWPSAVKALQKAVDIGQKPTDYANLGWAYYNSARMDIDARMPADAVPKLELAKTNLLKALAGDPAIADGVLQNLGAVQIDQGDTKGAIESLKPVVQKRPEWVFSTYALGTAYFKENNFEDAAKMFRSALEKEPNNVSFLSSLGFSEVKRKNGKEVKKIIEKLKTLNLPAALKLEQEAKVAKVA